MKNPIFSAFRRNAFRFFIIFLFLIAKITFYAQSVILDPSFSVTSSGTTHYHLLQTNGKILITGGLITTGAVTNTWIARLNSNGSLESNFKADTVIKGNVSSAAEQPDGKIVLGGFFSSSSWPIAPRNRLARINANGTLDTNFMKNQGFDNVVQSIALQPDGKIIAAGYFSKFNNNASPVVARIDSTGEFDNTFLVGSSFDGDVSPIAIQTDGKIILGGNFNTYKGVSSRRIIRLQSNGSIDNSFNVGNGFNGLAAYFGTSKIIVQPDGKIIACGTFTNYRGSMCNNIVRINPDGSVDSTFNSGAGTDGGVRDAVLQPDGKIILCGSFSNYDNNPASKIVRLNTNGQIDYSFNTGTGFDGTVMRLQLQPDDKITCTGNFSVYAGQPCKPVVRLMNTNLTSLDENLREKGMLIYPNPAKDKLIIDFTGNGNKGMLSVIIMDASARIVKSGNFSSDQIFDLEISELKNGIYFVSIYNKDELLRTHKMMKVD